MWFNGGVATIHPTKDALIRAALALLEENGESGFTVDDVLKRSGISKGSMYHHFQDFDDVVDHAHIRRFAEYVDQDIAAFAQAIHGCNTVEDFLTRINGLARSIHSDDRRQRRSERVETLARAVHREPMRDVLAMEQQRMTESFADLLREMQERNILKKDFSPKMYAVFLQAYSIGKVLDDVTDEPVDPDQWTIFVVSILRSFTVGSEHT